MISELCRHRHARPLVAKSRYRNRRRESGLAREYTNPLEVLHNDTNKVREVYKEVIQKELENGSTGVTYNMKIHHQATYIMCKRKWPKQPNIRKE